MSVNIYAFAYPIIHKMILHCRNWEKVASCTLLSLDKASTFAAWIWRGEVQMMRQPVPRVTTKTDTTMMVSFIDQEKMVRCPLRGAVGCRMKRQTTVGSLLPTENTHAFPPWRLHIYPQNHEIILADNFTFPPHLLRYLNGHVAWRTLLALVW